MVKTHGLTGLLLALLLLAAPARAAEGNVGVIGGDGFARSPEQAGAGECCGMDVQLAGVQRGISRNCVGKQG